MKRITQLLLLLLCGVLTAVAQDFAPGQQAQGLLESKNVTVDYATGLFHYKVPLYTLKSGEYELPITLDYVGKGVKEENRILEELIGHNWTLNAGGVVTRTIRGGFADEDVRWGYAQKELWDNTSLVQDSIDVNEQRRDGENDIFTAVFNGQSVNFIIRINEDRKIAAIPLNRTNVRIECEANTTCDQINGWIVTDENGNRYIYRQKEYTFNYKNERGRSLPNIRNSYYTSSWYLSCIEPLNCDPISFHYLADANPYEEVMNVKNSLYNMHYKATYNYGSSLTIPTYDFEKYQQEYNACIENAREYINHQNVLDLLNNKQMICIAHQYWVLNPTFDATKQSVTHNARIAGLLYDYQYMYGAFNDLIVMLEGLRNSLTGTGSNIQNAKAALNQAIYLVRLSMSETEEINSRTVTEYANYKINTPLLSEIRTTRNNVHFNYRLPSTKYCTFTGLEVKDVVGNRLQGVTANTASNRSMSELNFWDKDSVTVQKLAFDYYLPEPDTDVCWGMYGYALGQPEIHSLKSITLPDGGNIRIEYEANDSYDLLQDMGECGIRLKSLVMGNDTIEYQYPNGGTLVYDRYVSEEEISYGGISDHVFYSRFFPKGTALLTTGNNGLYYPYVTETVKGRGTQAYLFNVPKGYFHFPESGIISEYPHWLCGLPLGTALYDDEGKLVQLTKNRYKADLFLPDLGMMDNSSFLQQTDSLTCYSQWKQQMKAYDFYMNDTLPGEFGWYRYQYLKIPRQNYKLYYGGKTLLKERLVYRFAEPVANELSSDVFYKEQTASPFQRTVYHYDNLEHSLLPTRVETTDSQGTTTTTVTARVTEWNDATDPVLSKMKEKNLLTPVVKQAMIKNGKLLEEQVYTYQVEETDSVCYIGKASKKVYTPETTVSYPMGICFSSPFTYPETGYEESESYRYEPIGLSYMQTEEKKRGECQAVSISPLHGGPVMEAACRKDYISACDSYPEYSMRDSVTQEQQTFLNWLRLFYNGCKLNLGSNVELEYFKETDCYKTNYRLLQLLFEEDAALGYDIARDEFNALVDSTGLDNANRMVTFIASYEPFVFPNGYGTESEWGMTNEEYQMMLVYWLIYENDLRDSLFRYVHLCNYNLPLEVTPEAGMNRWNLCTLSKDTVAHTINYRITHQGGVAEGSFTVQPETGYSMQHFTIDLSGYGNVTSILVDSNPNLIYINLAPQGVEWKGTCYNIDGTVAARFTSKGEMEFYEYDAAHRLVRTTDKDGKAISAQNYNTINE